MMNAYDFAHDFAHTTGFVDEDLDFELPDPGTAMHFKKKRSQVMQFFGTQAEPLCRSVGSSGEVSSL